MQKCISYSRSEIVPLWMGYSSLSRDSRTHAPPILEGPLSLKVACVSTASQQMRQKCGESWMRVCKARTERITEHWALNLTSIQTYRLIQSLFPQLYIQRHGLMTLTGSHSTLKFNAESTKSSNCLLQGQVG